MDRSDRVQAVFEEASALPPERRAPYLAEACAGDAVLRAEVESLLRSLDDAGRFLASPTGETPPHPRPESVTAGAPAHEGPGSRIAHYKLLQLIGEGGFGSVFMAEQEKPVRRRVALKIIKPGMDTRQVIARFEAERQALAMMDHPNIARVFDAGSTETGRPYFVMEYIKGVPILEYCDAGKLDTRARLALFARVCHAIQHAHQKGVIHRDIKPSNVLVTLHDGIPVPKVIDFGIAKATSSELTTRTLFTEHRQMVGTPAYMSPEQAEMSGLDIDTRSDIYSLGVLLYELLTGTTPFDTQDLLRQGFAEMMRIIREVEPHKPSTRLSSLPPTDATGTRTAEQRGAGDARRLGSLLRGDLDWIVMKCLEKDRTRRYETASGLAADIRRHLNDEPVAAGPPTASYKLRKFLRRHRAQAVAGGIVAGTLLLGTIGTSAGLVWALDEKGKATRAANSESEAKVAAQTNEQKALTAKEQEARARKRAETITAFVTAALRSSDAQGAGTLQERTPGAAAAAHDTTILSAMDNAIKDLDSGRFADDPETEAALRNTIGVILLNNGHYDQARPLLGQALAMRERLFPPNDPAVGESVNQLAALHFHQSQYDRARPLLERAQAIFESARGPDAPEVAAIVNDLAVIHAARAEYAQAETLLVRALAIREKALGPDDPAVANGISNLANIYRAQGQFARAEPMHQRALTIREKAFGPDHPEVANSLHNLATLYREMGRHAEAEPNFTRALAIQEKALGPDHPLVATTLNNLGSLYHAHGKYARAETRFKRALAITESAYAPDHPDVAVSLVNLAALYLAQGKHARAEQFFTRALEIHEKALGPDHPEVAVDLNGLAQVRLAQSQYAQAEPLLRRALAIREKALGPNHPEVATDLNAIAEFYLSQGQYEQSEPLFARALAIRERTLDPDHPDLAISLSNLGAVNVTLKRYGAAEPLFTRALAIHEKAHDHAGVAVTLNNLATLALAQRQYDHAEPLYERAVASFRSAYGPSHTAVAQGLSGLARTRQALGKTAEARQGFDESLEMLRPLSPGGSPLLARVLWMSGGARLENKDPAAALPELEEALSMVESFLKPDHPYVTDCRETLARCKAALPEPGAGPAGGK